jgi:hypothetical protein
MPAGRQQDYPLPPPPYRIDYGPAPPYNVALRTVVPGTGTYLRVIVPKVSLSWD